MSHPFYVAGGVAVFRVADRLGPPRELDGVSIQGPVLLDKFNCDLFVTVSEDGYTAYDLGEKGFQHLWGGIRATHGVNYGKVKMLFFATYF